MTFRVLSNGAAICIGQVKRSMLCRRVYHLGRPSAESRHAFFAPLVAAALRQPVQPPAAPAPPVRPFSGPATQPAGKKTEPRVAVSPEEEEREEHAMLQQRMFMRDIVTQALRERRWALFAAPVTEEEAPDYAQTVRAPMDLSTLLWRVDDRCYMTMREFLTDTRLIREAAKQYHDQEDEKGLRIISRAHALVDTEVLWQDPEAAQRVLRGQRREGNPKPPKPDEGGGADVGDPEERDASDPSAAEEGVMAAPEVAASAEAVGRDEGVAGGVVAPDSDPGEAGEDRGAAGESNELAQDCGAGVEGRDERREVGNATGEGDKPAAAEKTYVSPLKKRHRHLAAFNTEATCDGGGDVAMGKDDCAAGDKAWDTEQRAKPAQAGPAAEDSMAIDESAPCGSAAALEDGAPCGSAAALEDGAPCGSAAALEDGAPEIPERTEALQPPQPSGCEVDAPSEAGPVEPAMVEMEMEPTPEEMAAKELAAARAKATLEQLQ
eukprot:gene31072-38974_t